MRTSPEKIFEKKILSGGKPRNLSEEGKKEISWNAEKEITEYLPRINKRLGEYRDKGHLDLFLEMAAAVKILNPKAELKLKYEERQKIKLNIKGDWQGFKQQLKEYRKPKPGDWLDYATLVMAGKIISSPKVEIPPEGGLKVE